MQRTGAFAAQHLDSLQIFELFEVWPRTPQNAQTQASFQLDQLDRQILSLLFNELLHFIDKELASRGAARCDIEHMGTTYKRTAEFV